MKKGWRVIRACRLDDERGVTLILVAILLFAFLGIAALAIDLSILYVARNELQNGADAGALAGARFLYYADGTAVNPGANQIAYDAATENRALSTAGTVAVEVNWPDGTDVQRGHWSFTTGEFTANNSTEPVDLWNKSSLELDLDTNFINAVRVVTRRQASQTRIPSFFARIFGHDSFELSAGAVAYIGFAGALMPEEVDQPIAICEQSILNQNDEYSCNMGRMINSGANPATSNTACWTNFSQLDDCHQANAAELGDLICSSGNPETLYFGEGMGAQGGQVTGPGLQNLINCWKSEAPDNNNDGIPDGPWPLTLPVIECPSKNCSNTCEQNVLAGAVTVNILWITPQGNDPHYNGIPLSMSTVDNTYNCEQYATAEDREACWNDFVSTFGLLNVTDDPAPYQPMAIYFLPSCEPHDPKGNTGGKNFGILAKIPVLVQ